MIAGLYDITCTKGSNLNKTIYIKNPDLANAQLVGWSSRMQVRPRTTSDTVEIELTTSNGRLVHDVENGTISIVLSDEDTDSLSLGDHVYDLELYAGVDERTVCKLLKGFFWVV